MRSGTYQIEDRTNTRIGSRISGHYFGHPLPAALNFGHSTQMSNSSLLRAAASLGHSSHSMHLDFLQPGTMLLWLTWTQVVDGS